MAEQPPAPEAVWPLPRTRLSAPGLLLDHAGRWLSDQSISHRVACERGPRPPSGCRVTRSSAHFDELSRLLDRRLFRALMLFGAYKGTTVATEMSLHREQTPPRSIAAMHRQVVAIATTQSSGSCREGTTEHGGFCALKRGRSCMLLHRGSGCAGRSWVSCRSDRQAGEDPSPPPGPQRLMPGLSCIPRSMDVVSDRRRTLRHGRSAPCQRACARPDVCSNGRTDKMFPPQRAEMMHYAGAPRVGGMALAYLAYIEA